MSVPACSSCRIAAAQAIAEGLTTYHCEEHGVRDVPPEDQDVTAVACTYCGRAVQGPPRYCCARRRLIATKLHAGTHPAVDGLSHLQRAGRMLRATAIRWDLLIASFEDEGRR